MNIFENKFPSELYHSYIIEGDASIAPELISYFENAGVIEKNSSDVLSQSYDAFTIDDGHFIKDWHSEKSAHGGKRFCILSVKFINHDAEQALLKMIEEPNENTHIFIIIPNADNLLGTIKSRAHIIRMKENGSGSDAVGQEFIKMNPKARMAHIAELVKKYKDDKEKESSGGVRHEATELLNSLEIILHEKFLKDKNNADTVFALSEVEKGRTYLSTPGASVKMILEHIALVI